MRNNCLSCLQCPLCLGTLQIMDDQQKTEASSYFLCNYCLWSSNNAGLGRASADELVKSNFISN